MGWNPGIWRVFIDSGSGRYHYFSGPSLGWWLFCSLNYSCRAGYDTRPVGALVSSGVTAGGQQGSLVHLQWHQTSSCRKFYPAVGQNPSDVKALPLLPQKNLVLKEILFKFDSSYFRLHTLWRTVLLMSSTVGINNQHSSSGKTKMYWDVRF